ncbi:MAG: HEAT repeat domain-containing protein [Phycisphaeraceae bacterium]|nr:HEAT repeat domain-containing protein [Phycisphaeraceae bacterium]
MFLTLAALLGAGVQREVGERPPGDSTTAGVLPMMNDPPLIQASPEIQFDHRNVTLWQAALQRPEFDARVDAIEAFAAAHRQGVKDLNEAIPTIEKLLAEDPHIDVRLAAARALIEFDHRSAAAALQRAVAAESNQSFEFVIAVDRALARWAHIDSIPMWIARLNQCSSRPTAAISAIRSLALVRAKEAGDPIALCVRDRKLSLPVRLEAARALSRVGFVGRSEVAAELASEPGPWGSLLALLALGSGQDEVQLPALDSAAVALIDSMTSNPDSRVRAYALELLRRADLPRALAKVELLKDADDRVRLEAVRTLAQSTSPVTDQLAGTLNDVSEPVRVAARMGLRSKWNQDQAGVQAVIKRALAGGSWRETEQAAILAGELKVAAVAGQLAALLAFDRAEVRLAATTSLRLLDLEETLPALLARAEVLTAAAGESAKVPERMNAEAAELAQIFMAFAQHRYRPATALLRKYIPKRSGFQSLSRAAAVYALGKIFESRSTPELASQLLARAEDNNPVDPEAADVRRFSIIALGRMGARETLPALRDLYDAENSIVSAGGASRWAVMHLENINLPPCRPVVVKAGPFFLESIGPVAAPVQP